MTRILLIVLTLFITSGARAQGPDLYQQMYAQYHATWFKRSLANMGDPGPLFRIMEKARKGQPITIGAIGGSITAGGAASDHGRTAYAPLVYAWWQHRFPGTTVKFVNAGIGATNSVFGAHRADSNLLAYHPDLVVIEFSVNDMGEARATESYEGLVRKVLLSRPGTAIICVATMTDKGENYQDRHLPVCKHYRLPMISYRDALWPEVASGNIKWSTLAPDYVHPSDTGHAIIAGLVSQYLENVYALKKAPAGTPAKLPAPLTANGYEHSRVYDAASLQPVSYGDWAPDPVSRSWKATHKGAPLTVEVEGGYVSVMFKRTNQPTGGLAYVVIDGDKRVEMDADFTGGWGEFPELKPLLYEPVRKKHTLSFYFKDDRPGKEFNISGILVANY